MHVNTQSILSSNSVLRESKTGCERLEALFAKHELERVFILSGLQEYTEGADAGWETWLDAALDSLADKAGQMQAPYPARPGQTLPGHFVFRPLIVNYNPRGGLIHLCGAHRQHVPTWKEMKSLRALQMNDRATEDLGAYYSGLRDEQILYVNPCDEMTTAQTLDITKGRRIVLCSPRASRVFRLWKRIS